LPENLKTLELSYIDHEQEGILEEFLSNYINNLGKGDFFPFLSYILKEMAGNANKANLKRIHFRRLNLNIHNPEDYEKGMESFRDEISERPENYFSLAQKFNYFVRINIFLDDNALHLLVLNNSVILSPELDRIREKFKWASSIKDMEEAMENVVDTLEGGGLGIILMVLMFRKLGVTEKAFKIMRNEKYTQTKISIPMDLVTPEESEMIADTILKEIELIPPFPQYVIALQEKIANPNASFGDLAEIIQRDPAMISDILKMVNSAYYGLPKKVNNIEEAVKMIGLKGVSNLIVSYSTQNLLKDRYHLEVIEKIMDHSYEVAFYAIELGKYFKIKNVQEDLYISGILHDLGKIMVYAIKPDMAKKIKAICKEKGISNTLLENLTNGYNHAVIGSKLAEKWNFPEKLVEVLRFHHSPQQASKDYFNLVALVYLADICYYYAKGEYFFSEISPYVLKHFKIDYQEDLEKLFKNLAHKFKTRLK